MNSKKNAAYALLSGHGFDFRADFHELGSDKVEKLGEVANSVGYRAPRNANGSTARCFFEYLARGYKPTAKDCNTLVYRFKDRVSVTLPGAKTLYLSATEARQLAKALNSGARNIKEQPIYSLSNFENVHIEIADPFRGRN